jgi:hypothetical protein
MTVFGSAVEVVEQYVAEIRPCFGAPRHPAMFLTERGTRIARAYINVALVGAPNLTAMNARSRSETRLSPRLQVFVPPNVVPSPGVSAKFSHRGRFRSSATHYRSRLRASAPTVARSRPQGTIGGSPGGPCEHARFARRLRASLPLGGHALGRCCAATTRKAHGRSITRDERIPRA